VTLMVSKAICTFSAPVTAIGTVTLAGASDPHAEQPTKHKPSQHARESRVVGADWNWRVRVIGASRIFGAAL
jgi:hypothetical protein